MLFQRNEVVVQQIDEQYCRVNNIEGGMRRDCPGLTCPSVALLRQTCGVSSPMNLNHLSKKMKQKTQQNTAAQHAEHTAHCSTQHSTRLDARLTIAPRQGPLATFTTIFGNDKQSKAKFNVLVFLSFSRIYLFLLFLLLFEAPLFAAAVIAWNFRTF